MPDENLVFAMNSFTENSLKYFSEHRPDLFGDGVHYQGFEVDPKYSSKGGLNSTIIFGKIIYQKGDQKHASGPMMLKLPSPPMEIYSDAENFHLMNESFFYTHVLPFFNSFRKMDSLFPHFYDCTLRFSPVQKEGLMVFENLQASDFRLSEQQSFLDYDHLSLMLRKLGNFHSYSFKAKKENPVRFRTLCDLFVNTYVPLVKKSYHILLPMAENCVRDLRLHPQYSQQLSKVQGLLNLIPDFVKQLLTNDKNDPTSVLCHGYYLSTNVMFRYEGHKPVDLKMVDMASSVLASPAVDLAVALYLHTSQEVRDEHWDDLIEEYYEGLSEYFEDIELPTKSDILEQFRSKAFIGYFIASYMLLHFQTDYNCEILENLIPSEYRNVSCDEIPPYVCNAIYNEILGVKGKTTLMDILKDMIDRQFI